MGSIRLTAAEATIRFLAAQRARLDGQDLPLFGGVWAIFGHGNVAGLGPALHAHRRALPTFRAHNEQAMAHAAIAFAKVHARRRMMACTTSIGPGATNMVTAAAVAHVNRRPDPVLQQVEAFGGARGLHLACHHHMGAVIESAGGAAAGRARRACSLQGHPAALMQEARRCKLPFLAAVREVSSPCPAVAA